MGRIDLKELRKVMIKYGKAWESKDSDLILECFVKNGIYQESPLAKPYKGHNEIRKFWNKSVVSETKNIKFRLGKCYLSYDKMTGFAEWKCKNNHKWPDGKWRKSDMAGIMVLKMNRDKITHLNEYWNVRIR